MLIVIIWQQSSYVLVLLYRQTFIVTIVVIEWLESVSNSECCFLLLVCQLLNCVPHIRLTHGCSQGCCHLRCLANHLHPSCPLLHVLIRQRVHSASTMCTYGKERLSYSAHAMMSSSSPLFRKTWVNDKVPQSCCRHEPNGAHTCGDRPSGSMQFDDGTVNLKYWATPLTAVFHPDLTYWATPLTAVFHPAAWRWYNWVVANADDAVKMFQLEDLKF